MHLNAIYVLRSIFPRWKLLTVLDIVVLHICQHISTLKKTFKIYPTPDHVTSGRECVLSESVARLCEHSHLRVLILFKIFSSNMPSGIQCSVIM